LKLMLQYTVNTCNTAPHRQNQLKEGLHGATAGSMGRKNFFACGGQVVFPKCAYKCFPYSEHESKSVYDTL